MLMTLLGSILGVFASLAADVMQSFQDRKDKAHERAIVDRQIALAQVLRDRRIEDITLEAGGAAV
jgi:predicted membrane chloride channel (bestrophin family)